MEIAIDAGEMDGLSARLNDASRAVAGVVPRMPGAGAFGPAVLGAAVAAFESAMRRDASALGDRWQALEAGVKGTSGDMHEMESAIIALVGRMAEPLP